jgi:hypothetical protein
MSYSVYARSMPRDTGVCRWYRIRRDKEIIRTT